MKKEKKSSQSNNKTMHRSQVSNNTITQDPHKILLEQRLFYKSLDTKTQHLHSSQFIANLQIPQIPENIKENMESDISEAELHATLKLWRIINHLVRMDILLGSTCCS